MQKYEVYEHIGFRRKFKKLPKEIRERFKKQINKLIIDPYSLAKPLGNKNFRELKNKGYRLYYYILNKKIIIILINVSNKKNQQEIINNSKKIKDYLSEQKHQ
jgi:mRNA-degrading endonuclease RelE of RelBE toxin-antitoxin system